MPIANRLPARSGTVLPRATSRAHRRLAARAGTTTHDGPGKVTSDSTPRSGGSELGTAHCCPHCGHAIGVISLIVALDEEESERAGSADRGAEAGTSPDAD